MIRVYDKDYSNNDHLNSNGLKIIQPIKCIEYKTETDWYIEVEIDDSYLDFIEPMNVVVVKTKQGLFQPFRIRNPKLDKNVISFTAKHIFFDLENYYVNDLTFSSYNGLTALNQLLTVASPSMPYTVSSDVTSTVSLSLKKVSVLEAIFKLIEAFNGHLVINNYNIAIQSSIGVNRGVEIRYGKNLQWLELVENWDNVVTEIVPTCGDRTYSAITADVSYDIPYIKVVSFESKFEDEIDIQNDVIAQATAYLNKNKYPLVNYTVKSDIIQDVYIGDVIRVVCKVELNTNVLAYTYDVLKDRIISVEFGNYQQTVKNLFSSYKSLDDIKQKNKIYNQKISDQSKVINEQTNIINGLYKNGYVVINDNEIYIVDALPKENATYVLRMNLGGIGFSSTGISGTYTSAWTLDGVFNADFIQAGQLNGINMAIGSSNSIFKANSNGIYLGHATFSNAPFRVNMAGVLTATSGTIGGWTLSTDRLYSGSGSTYVGIGQNVSNYSFWAGNSTPSSAPFSVTNAGALKATSGNIGGWTLGTDRLYAGSGSTYVGVSPSVSNYCFWAGNATPTYAPFWVKNDGTARFGGFNITSTGFLSTGTDPIEINSSVGYIAINGAKMYAPNALNYYFTAHIIPTTNNTYYLGNTSIRWAGIWVSGGLITSSDLRLKENINSIDRASEFVYSLKPVEYKMKDGSRKHYGFIAQDVKQSLDKIGTDSALFIDPIVKPDWDITDKEQNDKEHYLALRYEEFIAPMVKTIQELNERIKALEGK